MDLPNESYMYYGGIDPGLQGAIGIINRSGTKVKVWDLPLLPKKKKEKRWYNIYAMEAIFNRLSFYPGLYVGLEWPQVQPKKWTADRCEKLGVGKGYLEAFLVSKGLPFTRISPNLWKGRCKIPGKGKSIEANDECADYWDYHYPTFSNVIYGPRGGLKDGRMDALLIAHFLRSSVENLEL